MNEEQRSRYNKWNNRKKDIQESKTSKTVYFKEGDIWWCALGINIGSESFGKGDYFRRPILIIKKLSNDLCIALPLTSQKKDGTWFIDVTVENETKWVMLYQIRTLHKKRFQYKLSQLNRIDFNRVKEKLEVLLEFSQNHHSADAEIEGITPQSTNSVSDSILDGQVV